MPCHEDGSLDSGRVGSIFLPHFSPNHGEGFISIAGPKRPELGRWRYGIAATFTTFFDRHPAAAHEIDEIHDALVALDEARRQWRRGDPQELRSAVTRPTGRRVRREATRVIQSSLAVLEPFFGDGLERLADEHLMAYEETTWIHFRGRGLNHPWLTVCEQCGLVFRAQRARFCRHCRRHPLRISLHPLCEGGWHLDYRVGPRWSNGERELTVEYTARCAGCGMSFPAKDPKRRFCRNCGSPAGRLRRSRGSASNTGRQRFRFAHAEGAENFSVGFAYGLEGQQVNFETSNGVIDTDNAEHARVLDANPTLRRIE